MELVEGRVARRAIAPPTAFPPRSHAAGCRDRDASTARTARRGPPRPEAGTSSFQVGAKLMDFGSRARAAPHAVGGAGRRDDALATVAQR